MRLCSSINGKHGAYRSEDDAIEKCRTVLGRGTRREKGHVEVAVRKKKKNK